LSHRLGDRILLLFLLNLLIGQLLAKLVHLMLVLLLDGFRLSTVLGLLGHVLPLLLLDLLHSTLDLSDT